MDKYLKDNVYRDVLNTLKIGEKAIIITKTVGNTTEKKCLTEAAICDYWKVDDHKSVNREESLIEKAQESIETGNIQLYKNPEGGFILFEPYFSEPQFIVLGGGHIAKPLVEFAVKVGFQVTVVDDRIPFANIGRFPLAQKIICESFEKCFKLLNLNNSSFVAIVTRGHKHDMTCLKEVLKFNTAYVGMIGSKRRIGIINEQLLGEGYSQEQLQKVNAPIGVDVGAVTPEEIAVAIIAQVISFRRKKKSITDKLFVKANWPEFDRIVIEELSKVSVEPKAIVTIISTKGSVPRKAGAKMIVFPDGRIIGSIGGGCSEGEVINTAYDVIKSGLHQVQIVDMTEDIAEDEGMACGGVMEVFIEFSEGTLA